MSKCIIAGSSNNFALGPNHEDTTPSDLILPQNLSIKFVALGPKHGHIVDSNNSLFSWGRGSKYRLGTGDQKDLKVPTLVNATNQNFEISFLHFFKKWNKTKIEWKNQKKPKTVERKIDIKRGNVCDIIKNKHNNLKKNIWIKISCENLFRIKFCIQTRHKEKNWHMNEKGAVINPPNNLVS